MDSKIIEAAGLTVSFKSKKGHIHEAVKDISISLLLGETLAVVGGSGSGKTTLLRALAGLIKPQKGCVALFGKDISLLSSDELAKLRQKCGYVQQDPYGAIPPGLTALDAVIEPALIAGLDMGRDGIRKRAEELLESLGLTDERILRSRAVALSGGQRQRVQIARALMLSPKYYYATNPRRCRTLQHAER